MMRDEEQESGRIYHALFQRQIPPALRERFRSLSVLIEKRFSDREIAEYQHCVRKVRDLEALELAARHTGKFPIITMKFKAMLYLAESVPENYGCYVNTRTRGITGHLLLAAALVRSSYKLIKGFILLKRCTTLFTRSLS